jgi:hypothetical protein
MSYTRRKRYMAPKPYMMILFVKYLGRPGLKLRKFPVTRGFCSLKKETSD